MYRILGLVCDSRLGVEEELNVHTGIGDPRRVRG
jgi:hypothetical protein